MRWYTFVIDGDTVTSVIPYPAMQGNEEFHEECFSTIYINNGLVCAKDELDAFRLLSNWIRAGKILNEEYPPYRKTYRGG